MAKFLLPETFLVPFLLEELESIEEIVSFLLEKFILSEEI